MCPVTTVLHSSAHAGARVPKTRHRKARPRETSTPTAPLPLSLTPSPLPPCTMTYRRSWCTSETTPAPLPQPSQPRPHRYPLSLPMRGREPHLEHQPWQTSLPQHPGSELLSFHPQLFSVLSLLPPGLPQQGRAAGLSQAAQRVPGLGPAPESPPGSSCVSMDSDSGSGVLLSHIILTPPLRITPSCPFSPQLIKARISNQNRCTLNSRVLFPYPLPAT